MIYTFAFSMKGRPSSSSLLPALAAASLFCLAAAPAVNLIGLGPDEAVHAQPAMVWLYPERVKSFWPWLPWMLSSYMGTLKTWCFYFAFLLFGASLPVLRWTMIAAAAAGTGFWTYLCAELYGLTAAWCFAVWLGLDPSLVLKAGHDTGPMALSFFCSGLAAVALLKASRGKHTEAWSALAGLALGLGLWHKAHFLWLLAALPPALLLFARQELLARLNLRTTSSIAAGFLIGAGPFLYYNLIQPLGTLADPGHQGWSLSQHLRGLPDWFLSRLELTADMFNGRHIYGFLIGRPMGSIPTGAVWIVAWILLAALICAAARRKRPPLTHAGFWLTLSAFIFIAAVLSPVPVKFHHLYLLEPFPQLALASLAVGFLSNKTMLLRACLAFVVPAATTGLYVFKEFWREGRAGGSHQFFNGSFKLARWAETEKARNPNALFFCNQGLDNVLDVLTLGRVNARSFSSHAPVPELSDAELRRDFYFLLLPDSFIMTQTHNVSADDPSKVIAAAKRLNLSDCLRLELSIPHPDGELWAQAFRVCPEAPGTAEFWAERAQLALKGKKTSEALAFLDRGRSLPGSIDEKLRLARLYRWAGKPESGLGLLRALTRENPNSSALWFEHAGFSRAAGKDGEASQALKSAVGADMDIAGLRDLAIHRQNAQDFFVASAIFAEIARLDPKNPDSLHDKGVCDFLAGDKKTAEEEFRKALRLRPRHGASSLSLSSLLLEKNQVAEAEKLAAAALEEKISDFNAERRLRDVLQRARDAKQ